MNTYIGITEQGDGGLDLSWADKLSSVSGAIVITKNLNDRCIRKLLEHRDNVILHCGCTGLGGTVYEPNVPTYGWQLNQLADLIHQGFDAEHVVLRIDPIIPTPYGLGRVRDVLNYVRLMQKGGQLPDDLRVRISVIDMYPHARERFTKAGVALPYGEKFYAPAYMMNELTHLLRQYPFRYETCAERFLTAEIYEKTGCVSKKDLEILGIETDQEFQTNMQNRSGCLCLSAKRELLTQKKQCPHKCLYCYWRN